jgi:hypothetical protein
MAKNLAELLDEPEVVVESVINKLEHIIGWQSTDVRLLADINNKVRAKISDLSLDPDDTTGPELYHALLAKLGRDEQKFNMPYVKRSSNDVINSVKQAHKLYSVYAIRQSVAKELLRSHPPRRLMKELGYRSVDSMLKRESISLLYNAVVKVEIPRWQNVFFKDLANLTPSDFETREIEIDKLPAKFGNLASNDDVTTIVPLLGAVIVNDCSGSSMGLAMHIAKSINNLRVTSAHIKLKNVETNFGKNIVDAVKKSPAHPFKINVLPISWKSVFNHYGKRTASEHTEFFGPHLLHEDIKAHNSLSTLAVISPVFNWWQELEYVAKKTEAGIVSFNLMDVIANADKEFEHRTLAHMRGSLWHEFIDRYFAHPSVEQHFMQQLEPQAIPVIDYRPSPQNTENEIANLIEVGI